MASFALILSCVLLGCFLRVVETLVFEGADESCLAHIARQHGFCTTGSNVVNGGVCSAAGNDDDDDTVMLQVSRFRTQPLRVLFVRHAESFNNAVWKEPGITAELQEMQRVADPEITALGVIQAQALGHFVTGGAEPLPPTSILRRIWPIGRVYVSPMLRTLQTFQTAAATASWGPTPAVWIDIFENLGVHELHDHIDAVQSGLGRSQMLRLLPAIDIPAEVTEAGWYNLATRESFAQTQGRVARVAAHLRQLATVSDPTEGSVMLLTHGSFLALLLQELLGRDAWAAANGGHPPCHSYSNTAMTMVEIQADGGARLLFHNRTDHLSADLVSGRWASC